VKPGLLSIINRCGGKELNMTQAAVDEARLEELMGRLTGHMTGSALCFGIWLGDELGLYQHLNEVGPTIAEELAGKASCHPRLVREWLDGTSGGRIGQLGCSERPLRVVSGGGNGARR
jgi:hypothetical protein